MMNLILLKFLRLTHTGSTPWVFKHPEGRDMMQHDHPLPDTRNNISAEQNDILGPSARPELPQDSLLWQSVMEHDPVNKDRYFTTGKQCDISRSGFGTLAKRSTATKALDQGGNNIVPTQGEGSRSPPRIESSRIRRVMQPELSCQESMGVPDHINGESLISVNLDASVGTRKQGQETVSTKRNIGTKSVPHSLPQQSVALNINGERVVRTKQDDVNGSRKQGKVWTLDRDYGIDREVLERYSEKKLKDVTVILGVSRCTLKRICRRHDIRKWPPCKTKRFRSSVNPQASSHATHRHIEDQSLRNYPSPNLPVEGEDIGSIMVKATYRDDMIKFPLSLSSGKQHLENEVAIRLNLSVGTFKIKYLDEDEDWVLAACGADLRTSMSTLRSLGKTTIKMLVC